MAEEIRIPGLGESITEATIATWFKAVGDRVEKDEPVVELETDKVAMEVNAPIDGVLTELLVKEGDTVEVGALVALVESESDTVNTTKSASAKGADTSSSNSEETAGEASGEMVDIIVPQAGESVTEAGLGAWLKAKGDQVEMDEPVAELETDKAAMEVNAPVGGVLAEVLVEEGATIHPGDVIGRIQKGATAGKTSGSKAESASTPSASEKAPEKAAEKASQAPAQQDAKSDGADGPMSPAVRRLVADYNLDPASISGTGKDGRLTKADVLAAIDKGTARVVGSSRPQQAAAAAPQEAQEERVPMTRMRKRIAERLKDAQNTAAMLTTFNDVDMSAIIKARKDYRDLFEKKHGIKLGFMSFFVKAAVLALREIPGVNARIDGDEIVYQNFYNIGVAVSAPSGLVVPVVRDADTLSFADTEKAIAAYGKKARDGKLAIDDLMKGTFTISNGGIFGSLLSTPILNPPQSGILGMHRIEQRPVAVNGEVVIRPMMYLALSYDHRLVDGREAVTFLVRMKEAIEDPSRLLLDL
jgi:2-oxoglutarate dehydrogenase E2 component (dihydrolipoamide succinyltransferase)